jgi:hypothetical protein
METIKKKFKDFVHSETHLITLYILFDEFDFSIPDYIVGLVTCYLPFEIKYKVHYI